MYNKCLIMIFSLSFINAQVVFNESIVDNNVGGNGSIYGCDIDNDKDLDMLVAGIEDNSIIIYRNDNDNPIIWTKIIIDSSVSGARSVHANDFDGDGDLDVVGAAYTGNPISILWWRNDGGDPIVWTRFDVSQTFRNAHEVYSIDIDKDGDNDILGASSDQHTIALWRNDGGDPIAWIRQTLSSTEYLAKSVHAGDINNDGFIDVVGASIYSNDIIWWKNDGGNPINWTRFVIDYNFSGAHRVEAVDIDDDGDLDILGAGYIGHQIAWWRNDGGNPIVWNKQIIGTNFRNACIATAKDMDGDGDIDVIGTGQSSNQVAWWESDGGSPIIWTKHVITDNFTRPWPLFVGDVNGDEDNDIFVSSSHNGNRQIKLWENTIALSTESISSAPHNFKLHQNYPNPFNPTTSIEFELRSAEKISLNIFNINGNLIKSLIIDQSMQVGTHKVFWDGTDSYGNKLRSGVYIYQLYIERSNIYSKSKKMIYLK